MTKLNVLALHRMGDPLLWREAVRSLEYMIPECRPDLNCLVHNVDLPFPEYLKDVTYHLILLGPTFLCSRYYPSRYAKVLNDYKFIKESNACKVAMPQDDYDCSGILDEWMIEWGISRIYTVCPEFWDVLYPQSIKKIDIRLGYTGYISESWIEAWKKPKEHSHRTIDVSYRASKLPANFGRIGQLKWKIANDFIAALDKSIGLVNDISVDSRDLIPGDSWHEFIENSKFCLTTPSGSSLLDPYNKIRYCVDQYTALNPRAKFEEIQEKCFPGQDGIYNFTAISPRNIEAALAETVQIAVIGGYSRLMNPEEHYIPLNEDCSNIKDVIRMMGDTKVVNKIKRQCKESILSEPRLRRAQIVNEIIEFAELFISKNNLTVENQSLIDQKFLNYHNEISAISEKYWKERRVIQKIKNVASKLGAKRIQQLILPFVRNAR